MNDRSKLLFFFLVLFVFQIQLVLAQDKEKGIKISETEVLFDDNDMVGIWQHPTRAVWLQINADKKVYQCRVGKNELVNEATGTINNGKITWSNFWGTDKINIKNGLVSLKGSEDFTLIPVAEISDYRCSSPFLSYGIPDGDLSYGPGTGGGMGTGRGSGVGDGYGSGVGPGMGSGNGVGSGTGAGDDSDSDNPTSSTGITRNIIITSKPKATYTDSARQNGVTGTVVLRVTFRANGTIGSVSVVKGLPNGLTENAIAAAKSMRFEPAMKNGEAYSVTRNVEFSFTIY